MILPATPTILDNNLDFTRLTICHNHGYCILENGAVVNGVAKGICTGGGEQSRLLWATSDRAFPTGVEKEWNLYSRKPYETSPGCFYIDACTF